MRIEHVAIWTKDIEGLKTFYEKYFAAIASNKYENAKKQFESYFLSFSSGARLELMQTPRVWESTQNADIQAAGYVHVAFSVGSKEQVDELTNRLRNDGYEIIDGPRYTGDGYYESLSSDPDGNRIEITI